MFASLRARLRARTPSPAVRRRSLALAAAGGVALALAVAPVATFAANPTGIDSLPPSTFEIDHDANLKLDNNTGWQDWATLAEATTAAPNNPEKRAVDQPTGQGDDSYQGGTKEDTNCPGETTGSIPNNKSDLLTFHVYTEPGNAAHPGFLNLAWSRVSDPSGTTLMDFEFNQGDLVADACAGGPNVQRQAGDLLIEYAIDQGGSRATITGRTWSGTAWGPSSDLSQASDACDGQPCAVGTINTSPIPASESDGLIATGEKSPRTFGEAQIDLRTIFQPNKCSSFGSAMLKSRSSTSFTSQLKDFIRPVGIDLTNCGKVVIRKVTDPAGSSQSFSFSKSFSTDPATADTFSLTGQTTGGANVKTFAGVLFGTGYTVSEGDLPSGWTFDNIDCNVAGHPSSGVTPSILGKTITFAIDSESDVLDCTYTNIARATLRIDKVTVPSGQTDSFDFNQGTGLPAGTFSLTDTATPKAFTDLAPGTYAVDESDPTPTYDLTALGCVLTGTTTAKTATTSLANRSVSVTLDPGDDVTCTFTNTKRGSLTITKLDDSDPAVPLAGAVFTLYTDSAPVGGARGDEDTATTMTCTTAAVTGQCSIADIPLGDYWVVETTTPDGYATAADQHLTVTAGSSLTRSFTDPRKFKVIVLVCKQADNSLYSSNVTLPSGSSDPAATKPSLGSSTAPDAATLCSLGGAAFPDLNKGTKSLSVDIGTNPVP